MAAVTLPMVSTWPGVLCQLMCVRAQQKLSFSLELCVVDMNVVGHILQGWPVGPGPAEECTMWEGSLSLTERAFQCSYLLCSWC